jgi:hypothetical protein
MMGKSIWGTVGMTAFLCLPLMGVGEDTNNLNFLSILKALVPDLTQTWDIHRDNYSRMRERIDFLVTTNREPDNILNTDLVQQRCWSLIFRGIANVERFGRELAQGMQGTRVLAQAIMELEEAQRNGAPEEEISELRHRAFDARRALLQIFAEMGAGVVGNIGREREEAAEDLRFTEAFQRLGTETGIGRR